MEGSVRKKFARSLRKWADLIDPRVQPTVDGENIAINISCLGVEELEATLDQVEAHLDRVMKKALGLADANEKLKGIA